MFSNSLKMVKLDRNMSELWKIVRKMYNVNINVFFLLLCEFFINART